MLDLPAFYSGIIVESALPKILHKNNKYITNLRKRKELYAYD